MYADVSNCIGTTKIKNNQFYSIKGRLDRVSLAWLCYLKLKVLNQLLQKCKNFKTSLPDGLL